MIPGPQRSVLAALAGLLIACGDTTSPDRRAIATLEIRPDTLVMLAPGSDSLTITALDEAGAPWRGILTWASSEPDIVDFPGGRLSDARTSTRLLMGNAEGTTNVVVRADELTDTSVVVVNLRPPVLGSAAPNMFQVASSGVIAIWGQGLPDRSVATWNGVELETFPSDPGAPGSLRATIPAALLTEPGIADLAVRRKPPNPGETSSLPIHVVRRLPDRLRSVSAAWMHTCALDRDGLAYCWGSAGALGDGMTVQSVNIVPDFGGGDGVDTIVGTQPVPRETPVPVSGGLRFTSLTTADADRTCGVTTRGAVYCWGLGLQGELGTGEDGQIFKGVPARVLAEVPFESVQATSGTTCALSDGRIYCWGRLPWAPDEHRNVPEPFVTELRFERFALGGSHICALTEDGTAYCWGRNNGGQLGIGTTESTVTTEPAAVGGGHRFSRIRSRGASVCGLTERGEVYCWGGVWGSIGRSEGPGRLTAPTRMAEGLTFSTIAVGDSKACGVTLDGQGFCWGEGFGSPPGFRESHTPVPVPGSLRWSELSMGLDHRCGITTEGEVWCWGSDQWLQLGTVEVAEVCDSAVPSFPCSERPLRVQFQPPPP